ncbi:virion RNA polymerase [Roseobacter phage RD-1410W1-01]|uniref:VRNAP protein n=1 Tax=Roseobacter phage RD-1410W1-01 TaxID=1815984 RepID=A0A191VYL0_9CAUD|nr:virion RNA polymerase [Roseobacter phage RD-1410W1-01]ANJ20798.1 vRNAP protein [Roseobacter phage RD-1410W1-01]
MAQDTPLTSDEIIAGILNDTNTQDTLAVNSARGNDLLEREQVLRDLEEMSYGEIRNAYGDEVARNRFRLRDGTNRLAESDRASRTWGEAISDSFVGASVALGRTATTVLGAGAGYIAGELDGDPNTTGRSEAAATVDTWNDIWGGVSQENLSETVLEKQRFAAIEGVLDAQDSEAQFQREVEEGADPFAAALRRVGRDAYNAGERTLRDGALTGQVVSEGVGSLIPSAIIAGATGGASVAGTALLTNSPRALQVAHYTGSALGIGAVEASGTYSETVSTILDLPEEELMNSSVYQALLEEYEGDTARARVELAGLTGETAFVSALPASIALGVLTARFEAMPIRSFRGAGVAGGLRTAIAQTAEEAGQGANSALVGNYVQNEVGVRDGSLLDGVGEQAALGAIGGLGMAGVTSAPATIQGTGEAVVQGATDLLYGTEGTYSDPVRNAFLGTEGRTGLIQRGQEAASAVADRVDERRGERDEVRSAVNEAAAAVIAEPEVTADVEQSLEAVFRGTRRDFDGNKAVFAEQVTRLRQAAASMSGLAKDRIMNVLAQPVVQELEANLNTIDQNTADPVETITPVVEEETLALARTNPAAVNPETATRILEQNVGQISDADVKILQSASKIAATVNKAVETNVQINEAENISLTRAGKPTKAAGSQADTSRSILANGYVDRAGRSLRSVNDFASDIFSAAQSPTGAIVNSRGVEIPATQIMAEFGNFVRHMSNKVEALNDSFNRNNSDGRGPLVHFESLVGGTKFVPAGAEGGAKPVRYNRSNPSSVAFAERVASDLNTAVEVYNQVQATFPDLFGSFDKFTPIELAKAEDLTVSPGETLDVADSLIDYADGEQTDTTPRTNDETGDTSEAPAEGVSTDEEQNQATDTVEETPRTDEATDAAAEVVEAEIADALENSELQASEDAATTIEGDGDFLVDEASGERTKFYHGTNADFATFRDGETFLTTRKGLAREFARGDGSGTARLIEAEVELANPLAQHVGNNIDPYDFWMQNNMRLKEARDRDGNDSILLFNDNEAMVIASKGSQIHQTNPDFDGTVAARDNQSDEEVVSEDIDTPDAVVTEVFSATYQEQDGDRPVQNIDDFAQNVKANPYLARFAGQMVPRWVRKMEARLDNVTTSFGGKKLSARQHTLEGTTDKNGRKFSELREYRNTAVIDPTTGNYNAEMVELAGLVVSDWILNATPSMLNEVRDSLMEVKPTQEEFENLVGSVPSQNALEEISGQVLRLWNVRENKNAPIDMLTGVVEGLVAEMLTVAADGGIIELRDVPTLVDGVKQTTKGIYVKTKALDTAKARYAEEKVKGTPNTVREALFNEKPLGFQIGEPFAEVANTQNRSKVRLSATEKKALRAMQETPHYLNEGLADVADQMGDDLAFMLGWVNPDEIQNETLRKSVEGKNLSIEMGYADALQVIGEAETRDTPVYYSVGVTKVGRHQYQGINPQSNKILRALVAPNWATVNLNDKDQMDAFWLGVAQASDLFKIEKKNQAEILANVQDEFEARYGEAKAILKSYLQTGELQGNLGQAMGVVEMQQLAAVYAVAEAEFAMESGRETFDTSLSVELDGLTNGAANMMVNFGQGEISQEEFGNLQRIGLFLGETGRSINSFFGQGTNKDLYEKVSERSITHARNVYKALAKKPGKQAALEASMRFGAAFGNLKRHDDGRIEMTRNTAKNPMTKVNYGSGVKGVGIGVANDMLLEFYTKIQNIPNNVDYAEYFGYPEIQQDIRVLFGDTLPQGIDGAFEFPDSAIDQFQNQVGSTLGRVLAEATQQTIGDDIKTLNDLMVYSTNVQSAYLQVMMARKLAEYAPKNDKGDPVYSKIARADYEKAMAELETMSPLFTSDTQTLSIGGFEKTQSDLELSSSMTREFRQKSNLPFPSLPGVAAIPFTVIATGDAMMMNLIYSRVADKMPDTLPIFDGIDMPVTKIKEYAPLVNEQVAATWERDVFGMAAENFRGFLSNDLDQTALDEAIAIAQEKSEIEISNMQDLMVQLDQRHEAIKARKRVMKRLAKSVDQMGGSDVGFSQDGLELSRSEINELIRKELAGEKVQEDVRVPVKEFTAQALMKRMKGDPAVLKVIAPMIRPETRVVYGTLEQLNEYRIQNFPDDAQILKADANYDPNNDVIFLATKDPEAALHELVHAATMSRVLDHYNGNKHEAVEQLEALMDEFMGDDTIDAPQAKAAVLRNQTNTTPEAKAAALNEFMAWGLTNMKTRKALESKSPILKLAQKVVQLMKRIVGVPANMFDELVFATGYLGQPPVPPVEDGGEGSGPFSGKPTGYWIDMVKNWIDDMNVKSTPANGGQRSQNAQDVVDFHDEADRIINDLGQSNLLRGAEARANFRAVYIIMRAGLPTNTQMEGGLTKILNHVMENLNMADARQTQEIQSLMDRESDHGPLAAFLSLTQSSRQFREALGEIPAPEGENAKAESLPDFITGAVDYTVRKLTQKVDVEGDLLSVVDNLARSLHKVDTSREYGVLDGLTRSFDKADEFVSGAMSQLAEITDRKREKIMEENSNLIVRGLANAVTSVTNMLDADRAELQAAATQHQMNRIPFFDTVIGQPIRSFVNEVIGSTDDNKGLIQKLDEVNFRVVWARQQIRDRIPAILRNRFTDDREMAQTMNTQIAKTDLASIASREGAGNAVRLLTDAAYFNQRMNDAQAQIGVLYGSRASAVEAKADQLANFMVNGVPGKFLQRNAFAIARLENPEIDGVDIIDEYVTLKALELAGGDADLQQYVMDNEEAAQGLLNWLNHMNQEEETGATQISGMARMNHYKGYQPMVSKGGSRIKIDTAASEAALKAKGWRKVQDIETGLPTGFTMAYFVNDTAQQNYSQGVLQNAGQTFKGVDKVTGQSTFGTDAMEVDVTEQLVNFYNSDLSADETEFYAPVYGPDGTIEGFEFLHNREVMENALELENDIFTLSGIKYGRTFEENASVEFNKGTVEHLASLWHNRDNDTSEEFVNLKTSKNPQHREAYRLMPQYVKDYADEQFGEDTGFMVRKDHVDLSVGYREASVTDIWTGQNNMPAEVNKGARQVAQMLMGKNAMRWLAQGERALEETVSNVKSTIIIKSVQVAYQNAVSNVWQLANQGVPIKAILKGTRDKIAELQEFEKIGVQIMDLSVEREVNPRKRVTIDRKISALEERRNRMSIAPMIEAGQFKNLVEGLTEQGEYNKDWEQQLIDLAEKHGGERGRKAARVALISKDTKFYKFMNTSTQYGDLVAKSIYYDHLIAQGLEKEEALAKMNNNFINYGILPGRVRSLLERMGGTWFFAYKIRAAKVAMRMMRENPVRSLTMQMAGPDVGNPVDDNIFTIGADRLDFSTGTEMFFTAPEMHPWAVIAGWN